MHLRFQAHMLRQTQLWHPHTHIKWYDRHDNTLLYCIVRDCSYASVPYVWLHQNTQARCDCMSATCALVVCHLNLINVPSVSSQLLLVQRAEQRAELPSLLSHLHVCVHACAIAWNMCASQSQTYKYTTVYQQYNFVSSTLCLCLCYEYVGSASVRICKHTS